MFCQILYIGGFLVLVKTSLFNFVINLWVKSMNENFWDNSFEFSLREYPHEDKTNVDIKRKEKRAFFNSFIELY